MKNVHVRFVVWVGTLTVTLVVPFTVVWHDSPPNVEAVVSGVARSIIEDTSTAQDGIVASNVFELVKKPPVGPGYVPSSSQASLLSLFPRSDA